MSKYVEQAKHTLSLSASANSVAALGNMKAILDGVSDSSTGSTGNSDKQTDLLTLHCLKVGIEVVSTFLLQGNSLSL